MGVGMWDSDVDTESVGVEEAAEAEKIVAELQTEQERQQATTERIASATTEAQIRFEKASLYRTLLEGSLFEENSGSAEIVAEVESEIKSFVLERFETLLGMKEAVEKPSLVSVQSPFGPEETEALKFLASRLINSAREKKAPTPKTPQLKKAKTEVQAVQKPALRIPKAAPARPGQAKPAVSKAMPQTVAVPEVVRGVAKLAKAQGKRVVVTPDGRIGKLSNNLAQTRPPTGPSALKPLPMPTAEEETAKAAVQAQQNSSTHPLMQASPVAALILKNAAKRVAEAGSEDNE